MTEQTGGESGAAQQSTDGFELPVWATVGEAYAIWFANLGLWLKLTIVPFIFLALLSFIGFAWFPAEQDPVGIHAGVLSVVFIGIMFVVEVPLLTAWHRVILTPEDSGSRRYRFGSREWRYGLKSSLILVYVVLAVAVFAIMFNIGLLAVVGTGPDGGPAIPLHHQELMNYAVILPATILVFRFLGHLVLALPALALGQSISRQDVKSALRSNEWRLAGIVTVSMLPAFAIGFASSSAEPALGPGMWDLVNYLPNLILAPVIVGVISIAYRELIQKPAAE